MTAVCATHASGAMRGSSLRKGRMRVSLMCCSRADGADEPSAGSERHGLAPLMGCERPADRRGDGVADLRRMPLERARDGADRECRRDRCVETPSAGEVERQIERREVDACKAGSAEDPAHALFAGKGEGT